MAMGEPASHFLIGREAVAAGGQLADANQTCVAVAVVEVIKTLMTSREAFRNQLSSGRRVRREDNVKVCWIRFEHSQHFKSGRLYHHRSSAWVGRIRMRVRKKRTLHLTTEGLEQRSWGKGSATMIKVR
jgi:hypothetical protein